MKEARVDELPCPVGETEDLCDLYEQLRGFILEASGLPGQVYGLGVLMRQGMRVWMNACGEHAQLERASSSVADRVASCLPSPMQAELTRTLASLVWNHNEREVKKL